MKQAKQTTTTRETEIEKKKGIQITAANFSISGISSFTFASIRSTNVTTDSIDVTAMGVGRALVYIYNKVN